MSSFAQRSSFHDGDASTRIAAIFQKHGWNISVIGQESDTKKLSSSLKEKNDQTSLMLRYRPDKVATRPGFNTIFVEIKTAITTSENYAIEFRSWEFTSLWNPSGENVCYVFLDSNQENIPLACWGKDIPPPRRVRVPGRWDQNEQIKRIFKRLPPDEQTHRPNVSIEVCNYYGVGSGTAFFLLPKTSNFLIPLPEFLGRIV